MSLPGWYPDPHLNRSWRWWDGLDWSDHTRQDARRWPLALAGIGIILITLTLSLLLVVAHSNARPLHFSVISAQDPAAVTLFTVNDLTAQLLQQQTIPGQAERLPSPAQLATTLDQQQSLYHVIAIRSALTTPPSTNALQPTVAIITDQTTTDRLVLATRSRGRIIITNTTLGQPSILTGD
jgi:hypothetical protein